MASLKNKVVAITGAGSGIGLATAKHLFSLGAKVSISDRSPGPLGQAAETILAAHPGRSKEDIMMSEVDVTSSAQVSSWIEDTVKRFGKLDGAVNSAGIRSVHMGKSKTRDITDENWAICMNINSTGLFYCMRAELNAMVHGGSIVNVASLSGITAVPGAADYVASKHAVVGLTRTAAKEEGRVGIRVNAVAPGVIDTPMTRNVPPEFTVYLNEKLSKQPISRAGRPEEVAQVISFLLSDDSSFVNGQIIRIDGGSSG